MAIQSYFFNAVKQGDGTYDRTYNSEDMTSYLDLLVGDGVFPNPSTNLQVQANSGMTITVGAGQGWIDGHKMINTAALNFTLDASDVLLNRIDLVIFYVDYTTRDMGIGVLKGTPATTAVAPTLTRTTARWEMCLAQISVAKQVTEITASMITDTRGNSSLCGYVQGLIQQVDTTTLWNQFQAAYQEAIDNDQASWDEWFQEVKDELASATLLTKREYDYVTTGASENTFDVATYIPSYKPAIDILEIRINGLTVAMSEYTRSGTVVTLTTPITHVGTPVSFCVYQSIDGSDAETIVDQVVQLQAELDATKITASNGDVELYLTESTDNLLTEFIGLGTGFHTIAAESVVINLPKAVEARLLGQLSTNNYGYLLSVHADGSVYSNYYNAGTWVGWRCLFNGDPALLYQNVGGVYPPPTNVIFPNKKLSECRNGWALTWTGYESGQATDSLVQTTYIPKKSYTGNNWNGEQISFPLISAYAADTTAPEFCTKTFTVTDTSLTSGSYNATGNARKIVLRSIQEY